MAMEVGILGDYLRDIKVDVAEHGGSKQVTALIQFEGDREEKVDFTINPPALFGHFSCGNNGRDMDMQFS